MEMIIGRVAIERSAFPFGRFMMGKREKREVDVYKLVNGREEKRLNPTKMKVVLPQPQFFLTQ
jgi:hypothetical protein